MLVFGATEAADGTASRLCPSLLKTLLAVS